MNRQIVVLSLGLAGLVFAAGQAQPASSPQCAPRASVVAQLASSFGEARQALGLAANSAIVEVFASLETGTWTIVATGANGISCLVASGRDYQRLDEAPAKAGTDA